MIRLAETEEDLLECVRMGMEFNDGYYDVPINPDKALAWAKTLQTDGIVLMAPDGFIYGMCVEDPLRDWTSLVEFGWYADGSGAALLEGFIEYGRAMHANEVRMSSMNTSSRAVDVFLRRQGFSLIEKSLRLTL